jgi:hypothetical protein
MALYHFYIALGSVSQKEEMIEIKDEEMKGMTEEEKEEYVYKTYFKSWLGKNADIGFSKEE